MKVIHILRKPVSTSSVAKNVLKHGCGALNIDACRIGFTGDADKWTPGSTGGTVYGGYMDGSGQVYKGEQYQPTQNTAKPHNGGRWPANMVLVHKTECENLGTMTVRGSPPTPSGFDRLNRANAEQGYRPNTYQMGDPPPPPSRVDSNGKETVAAWNCAPGCPVPEIDAQGEVMGSHSAGSARAATRQAGKTGMFHLDGDGHRFEDSGGVSRFFKQIK